MEFCCQTLNGMIKHLSNELMENNSEMMKTLCYICCELFGPPGSQTSSVPASVQIFY